MRRTKVKNELRIERNESLLAVPYLTQASVTSNGTCIVVLLIDTYHQCCS